MEDGLGVYILGIVCRSIYVVLILVLVEDGLGVLHGQSKKNVVMVLILVLVEDGLGGVTFNKTWTVEQLS